MSEVNVRSAGDQKTARPQLPKEGERDYLEDHPFDLKRFSLAADILVEEVRIPMRDGIRLAATVFRPKAAEPVPVITTMTPYGKDQTNQWDLFRDPPVGTVPGGGGFYLGEIQISNHVAFEAPDPGFWVPNGYAVALIDLPGRGKSESNPHTPGPESRWWDTMKWLSQQSWCTGKIGMSGVSALAATQWIAAKGNCPPELKAIIPWEGINETGPGGGYGGIPETAFSKWIESDQMVPYLNPDAPGPEPYIADWKFDTSAISIPALICASFSDQELHSWDSFDAFTRLTTQDKWLYNHRRQKWAAYYGTNELALQKRFLDRFLKDKQHSMDGVPKVRLEIHVNRFEHKVVYCNNWPVDGTTYHSLYLDSSCGLLRKDIPTQESSSTFAPLPVADPTNRVCFDYRFDKDTDLVGHMALKLFIEAEDTDDVDIFATVEKLDSNGDTVYFFSCSGGNANGPVARGWLRASCRELDKVRSTSWRPVLSRASKKPLSAREIVEADIAIMPSGTTFKGGESLRVVLASWSVPGHWEGGEARQWDTLKNGRCRVHTGGRHPSQLLIPVVRFPDP